MQKWMFALLSLLVFSSLAQAIAFSDRTIKRQELFRQLNALEPEKEVSGGFIPVAKWSGRLIYPQGEARRADGGVYLELHNWDSSKLPELKSPIVALVWPNMPFGTKGFDVQFSDRVFKFIKGRTPETAAFPAPWRLNGLKGVSALESLAGHRPQDDVIVSLKKVSVVHDDQAPSGIGLVIEQEPVQISGTHVALVTFIGAHSDGTLVASHWNRDKDNFSGEQFEVLVPKDVPHTVNDDPERRLPQSSVDQIWSSPLNAAGWYAYGHFEDGFFVLDALEPRAVMKLQCYDSIRGKKNCRKFIECDHWDNDRLNEYQSSFRSVLLQPNRTKNGSKTLTEMDDSGSFLVLNLFGWWGRNGKAEREQALRSGHFALGFADLNTCPFTGEKRIAIEYKQVYGLNGEDIIGGSMSWAHYNGNLHRGWMYLRPNSDALIDFQPLMEPFPINGKTQSVRRVLEDNLEHIMAAYRTGAGEGVSVISELNSCAQDSTQGTFLAFESVFAQMKDRQAADDDSKRKWKKLEFLYNSRYSLSSEFYRVPWAIGKKRVWRDDWLANLRDRNQFTMPNAGNNALSVFDAYSSSRNSILPRRTFDSFAKLFLEHEAPILLIQTIQIGGRYDGLFPLSPEKLNWEKLRGLIESGMGMLFEK